ncbi:MAG: FtsX-like permease family protein [Candidatus Shapirobacteria bacterium]
MKVKDLLNISLQNFKNRKSRIFFTVLGVSVAIAAVLFLVSFGYGLQSSLLEKITTKDSLLTLDVMSSDAELIKLNEETLNKISGVENVEKISPHGQAPGNITLGDLTSESTINIIDLDYIKLEGISPKIGRNFESGDQNKIIINSSIAKLFNLEENDIIGKKIKMVVFLPDEESENASELKAYNLEQDFEILGLIEDSDTQGQIFIKNTDVLSVLPIKEYSSVKVKINNQTNLDEARNKLISMGFLVSALSDTVDQANQIFGVIQIVLGIFGTVALIVAAIGLINTMTISLLERTNEIGIMRAIGAAPGDIMWLFLGESLMIGFLGGVSGIILGVLSSQLVQVLVNLVSKSLGGEALRLFSYPIWFIFFIIILSSLVGLVGGFYPARRASKLNPLDALRYK